jgi:hypothetical protein
MSIALAKRNKPIAFLVYLFRKRQLIPPATAPANRGMIFLCYSVAYRLNKQSNPLKINTKEPVKIPKLKVSLSVISLSSNEGFLIILRIWNSNDSPNFMRYDARVTLKLLRRIDYKHPYLCLHAVVLLQGIRKARRTFSNLLCNLCG